MIECLPLNDFDETSWEETEQAFLQMLTLEYGQFWLPQPETSFVPAEVRLGWRPKALLVFATLQDVDIFSKATADGQPMWQLGDVFEIFLRVLPDDPWYEFHVTPNNHHLELCWPDDPQTSVKKEKRGGYETYIVTEPIIKSRVHICKEQNCWQVLTEIPARQISGGKLIHAGDIWLVSFCRYDAFRDGRSAALSSTSDFTKPAFHCQQEWKELCFVE